MNLTPMETKLCIFLAEWKMLQTLPIIVKNGYHIWNKTDIMPIIEKMKENINKVGCCNKVKNAKMC
jgi:predicted transcriptional regulator